MKNITQVENLKGKKVLLRLDLNVPIKDGEILNDFRIKKVIPTINFLKDKGAKVIILSHIGRARNDTLRPVADYLKKYIDLIFVRDVLGEEAKAVIGNMEDGQVVMLENLRQWEGEVANDESFSKQLASLGDIYVNDAFANSHREHSSMVGIPKFLPSYSGILLQQEIDSLSKVFHPTSPSLFIIGGNKLNTKLDFIKKSLGMFDKVFVGGALANNFFKEEGFDVGKSFVVEGKLGLVELMKNEKLILPVDVVVENKKGEVFTKKPNEVLDDEKILDAGSETVSLLKSLISEAKFILLNGPLGDYEKGFGEPTNIVIDLVSNSDATTIVGGGDTTALINQKGIEDKFTFVSTGGGAMLGFLLNETLPAIEILNSKKQIPNSKQYQNTK